MEAETLHVKNINNIVFLEWLHKVLEERPKDNDLLDSTRGQEIAQVCINFARDDFNWHRDDADTFWIDVQLMTYYKLTDEEVRFVCRSQPGTDNWHEYADERNAYNALKRSFDRLRKINIERESEWGQEK